MNKIIKKFLAAFLAVVMLIGIIPTYATTVAEGNNGKTIYFTFDFYNEDDTQAVTEVSAGENFFVYVNFFGNPSVADDSMQGYNLLIGYDPEKVSFPLSDESFLGGLNTPLQLTTAYSDGVALVQGVASGGIKQGFKIATSGTLFKLFLTATEDLSESDLNTISLVKTTNVVGKEDTYVIDGNLPRGNFTVVQAPTIIIGDVEGNIYSDATVDAVKNTIQSFTFLNASGESTEYTSSDSEWADLSVILPATGLKVGDNTVTASYKGYTCDFTVKVLNRVESIAVTTAPERTTYTAFETFDKTGMVVTATYEDGTTEDVTADCVVDTETQLKVADTSVTITYGDKNTTQAITVVPLSVKIPVASTDVLTYTGLEQTFTYSTYIEEEYVSITGDAKGKNAGTYTATASLKDKDNTVWSDDTTSDKQVSWTILKATVTNGIDTMTKKFTATYAELPTSVTVAGVNSETIPVTIVWYTDADCSVAAPLNDQIAASYIGQGQTVTLYYKAANMDNYEDYKGSVIVEVTDKDAGTISWENVPAGLVLSDKTVTGTYTASGYTLTTDMFAVKAMGGTSLGKANSIVIDGFAGDKITNVGTYTVTVLYEDKDNKAKDVFTVVVTPKSIDGYTVSLKVGDGSAVETSSQNPLVTTYTGSEITPVVTGVEGITTADYTVDSQIEGTTVTAKDVSETPYLVAVKGTGNYTGTAYGYWNIAPAKISVSAATVIDKVYNGSVDDADVTGASFTGLLGEDTLTLGTDFDVVSAVYADKNAGENVNVAVTVSLKDVVKNYVLENATVTAKGKITKASAPDLSAPSVQTLLSSSVVTGAKDYTFNLAGIITGAFADAGDLTYAVKTEGSYVTKTGTGIDGSTLKVSVAEPQNAAVTDSVIITVSSTNYEDVDVTVNFLFKDKTTVEITLDDVNVTYGESYTVNGHYADQPANGYTWTYQYVGIEGTDYPVSSEAPVNAGKYSVTAYYEDNTPDSENPAIPGHVGKKTATLTINKKTLTLTDGDVSVTKVYDGTTEKGVLTGALAVNGIVLENEVYVDMTNAVISEYPNSNAGTYTVEISGFVLDGSDSKNYSIPQTYNFNNATITKQLQNAVTINGSDEDILLVYGSGENEIVLGGGNGTGAYKLTSSDESILKLDVKDANVWTAKTLKVGTVTITAYKLGDNNYEESEKLTVTVEIAQKDITEGDFVFDLADKEFTGKEIKPSVASHALIAGIDYDVAYENNTVVGTATIKVTAKGNYKGEIVKTFTVKAKTLDLTEFSITGLIGNFLYSGLEIIPNIGVKWGSITLIKTTDFDVAFTNNINAGTATVTITGKGNYTGTITKTYTIKSIGYTGTVTVSASDEQIVENTVLTANAPTSDELTYQWKRNGVNIDGQTESTYTVTAEDLGAKLSVAVTSTGNRVGVLECIEVAVGKTMLGGTVELSGTSEITASLIDTPAEEHFTIIWLRDGQKIDNAQGLNYALTNEDKGHEITVLLTSSGEDYTGEVLSANSVIVPADAPTFTVKPETTVGDGRVTVSLKANDNGANIINYQILVDGNVMDAVDGEQTSYTITGLTNGTQYAIQIIATNSVGSGESEVVTATPKKSTNNNNNNGGGGGGGASTPSYAITISNAQGGTVTSNVKKASTGDIVTVNVTPDEGFKLSKLTVLDKNGESITVTEKNNAYTFKMPKTAVTITATFTKVEQEETPTKVEFIDVDAKAYYYNAVQWAVENNVTNGTGANIFSPNAACTRAQMVTFLWRAAGSPKAQNTVNPFTDVQKDSYYYDALLWAVKNGITSGVSATKFDPNGRVNRAQTVTFLWRLAKSPALETLNPFKDVAGDTYYTDAVLWAVSENVTNGLTATSFGPNDACTRGQIVTFIYRNFVK